MSIGERISTLRIEKQLSQNQLAKALNVSRQAVSKWENDQSAPDTFNLIRLADVLDSNVEYLATGKAAALPFSSSVVTVEKVVEKPIEVERIIEKPVEIEKIVEVEKIVHIDKFHETVIEKPIVRRIVRTKYIRNPVEFFIIFIVGIIIGLVLGVAF